MPRINKAPVKYVECYIQCSCKLNETEKEEIKVCMNKDCIMFEIQVTNWFNFEE